MREQGMLGEAGAGTLLVFPSGGRKNVADAESDARLLHPGMSPRLGPSGGTGRPWRVARTGDGPRIRTYATFEAAYAGAQAMSARYGGSWTVTSRIHEEYEVGVVPLFDQDA